jgi:hypothetical protein
MRITTKIATAGVAGLSRFPVPNATIEECLAPDGSLDESKVRKALDIEQVQIASTDDRRVLAFAMEYLKQTRSVVEHLAKQLGPSEAAASPDGRAALGQCRTSAATSGDSRCERNMRKGRYAFVRTDITGCLDGIHVRLTVQNPREVVGNAELFAHEFAVMCARILNYLADEIANSQIILIPGENCDGIFAEARELDRRCDLRAKRDACPSLRNGYCSPFNPSCPLYHNGKCYEP